ncbi:MULTISPECIES: hypothetical protein, partial [unclassified Variovorax]|uniref:hypothetical protein n=1 Tax=unclassified Variovorax TaxID=663243 RepID=UPI001C435FFF
LFSGAFDYALFFQTTSTFEDLFLNPLNQLLRARPEELDRCNILRCAVSRALDYAQFSTLRSTDDKFFKQATKSPGIPGSASSMR